MMRVTVLPPTGDMNGDALLDVRDISRMAASAGRTDRPLCDLDGSGTVAWNDFRLLLNTLGDSVLDTTNAPETVLAEVSVVVCAMWLLSLAFVRQLLWRSGGAGCQRARKCRKWAFCPAVWCSCQLSE